jgi:hypothetical protein
MTRSALIVTNMATTPGTVAVPSETGGLVLDHHEEGIQDPALTQEAVVDGVIPKIADLHAAIIGEIAGKEGIVASPTTVVEMKGPHVSAADHQSTKTRSNLTVRSLITYPF